MLTRVTERAIETEQGPRTAVIVEPASHTRVQKDRLVAYRRLEYSRAAIDDEVLAHATAQGGRPHVIVFRGAGDHGSWDLDSALSESEQIELGYHLVAEQLPTYRRLVGAGVFALLHVDWPPAAVKAYIQGTAALLAELEAQSIPEVESSLERSATGQIDRWVLRHLTFFFSDPIEQVIESVLRTQIPLLESRIPHLQEMVASLPRDSLV